MQAQVNEHITLYDGGTSSTGYSLIKDEYYSTATDFCSLIASTQFDNSSGMSRIRLQSVSSVSKTVNYDRGIVIGDGINPFVTGIVYDPVNNVNVITGFCQHQRVYKMFIATLNEITGAVVSYKIHSILQGGSSMPHTYALDVAFAQNTNTPSQSYFVVGYIASDTIVPSSEKMGFVACFSDLLNITWVKGNRDSSLTNNYNSICIIEDPNLIVTEFVIGGTNIAHALPGNSLQKGLAIVKMDYSGVEIDNRWIVSDSSINMNPANFGSQDFLLCDIKYDTADKKLFLLSWNGGDESINVDKINYSGFSNEKSYSVKIPAIGFNSFNFVGFNLDVLQKEFHDFIGITGYSDRFLNFNNTLSLDERDIFCTYMNLGSTVDSSKHGDTIFFEHFPIINAGHLAVNFNPFFDLYDNGGAHPNHAFMPNNAIHIQDTLTIFIDTVSLITHPYKIYSVSNERAVNGYVYPAINHSKFRLGAGIYACEDIHAFGQLEADTTGYSYFGAVLSNFSSEVESQPYEFDGALGGVSIKDCQKYIGGVPQSWTPFKTSSNDQFNTDESLHVYLNETGDIQISSDNLHLYQLESMKIFDLAGRRYSFQIENQKENSLTIFMNQPFNGLLILSIKQTNGHEVNSKILFD